MLNIILDYNKLEKFKQNKRTFQTEYFLWEKELNKYRIVAKDRKEMINKKKKI